MGLSYDQAMDLPQSLILDMLAVEAIEKGGAERKMTGQNALDSLRKMAAMR